MSARPETTANMANSAGSPSNSPGNKPKSQAFGSPTVGGRGHCDNNSSISPSLSCSPGITISCGASPTSTATNTANTAADFPLSRIKTFWHILDADDSGSVDFEEFLCWFYKIFEAPCETIEDKQAFHRLKTARARSPSRRNLSRFDLNAANWKTQKEMFSVGTNIAAVGRSYAGRGNPKWNEYTQLMSLYQTSKNERTRPGARIKYQPYVSEQCETARDCIIHEYRIGADYSAYHAKSPLESGKSFGAPGGLTTVGAVGARHYSHGFSPRKLNTSNNSSPSRAGRRTSMDCFILDGQAQIASKPAAQQQRSNSPTECCGSIAEPVRTTPSSPSIKDVSGIPAFYFPDESNLCNNILSPQEIFYQFVGGRRVGGLVQKSKQGLFKSNSELWHEFEEWRSVHSNTKSKHISGARKSAGSVGHLTRLLENLALCSDSKVTRKDVIACHFSTGADKKRC